MVKKIAPVCLLSMVLSPGVHALEWQLYKFAEIGVRGTDNFRFGESNELTGSIRPSVDLVFTGNRVQGNIIAEVEAYRFQNEDFEVTDPRVSLLAEGTLIDNFMYFGAAIDHGKLFPGGDEFDLSENTEAKSRVRFGPFLAGSFGQIADYYFGYGHESIYQSGQSNQLNTVDFNIERSARYGGFTWGLGGYYGEDGSDVGGFNNAALYAKVGHTVGQNLWFQLRAGQERSDFGEDTNDFLNIDETSNLWEASVRWTPSARTALSVGYGDRFFGAGPSLTFEHNVRNSSLTASYTRGVTNTSQLLGAVTPFGDSGATTLLPTTAGFGDSDVSEALSPFVDRRFEVSYKLAGRRSDLIADAAYSTQQQLSSNAERSALEGRIALDRHLSPLTTFRVQYDLIVDEDENSIRRNENRLGVSFIYNFDRRARRSIVAE